jgi:hypothetical protein
MRPVLALAAVLFAGTAGAQWDQAISDNDLLDPWIQAKAVVIALPADRLSGVATRADLIELEGHLSSLRTELENTAISIAGRPEFAYDAAERSYELSQKVGKVQQGLDALFAALAQSDRADVKSARESIGRLQKILAERVRFERDILNTVGSGSKNAIQALAARWWTAGDRVGEVGEAIAGLRQGLAR